MSEHPWVCSSCRSVNQPRENRCYSCRTPRELVEADPQTLLVAGAGSKPTADKGPIGTFRSSGDRAFMTQVMIVLAIAATLASSFLNADLVARLLDEDPGDVETSLTTIALVGGAGLLLGGAALVSFAAWLSRVVANVPAVGLGWPNVTPSSAIFESIIPGVNLYRVPAILRDVVTRLEAEGRGDALIAAAWLALVGGALLPRVGRQVTLFLVGPVEELTAMWVVVGQLGLGLTVVGAGILVVLIQWIESRMEQRAAALVPSAAASQAPAPPQR